MRVLIVLTPLMYREAIAHSLRQNRPHLEVRIAAPEAAEGELRSFAPHLLVHTDTDGLEPAALECVPFWVQIGYSSGSMDAWTTLGASREVRRHVHGYLARGGGRSSRAVARALNDAYAPECVEGLFSELRADRVLRSWVVGVQTLTTTHLAPPLRRVLPRCGNLYAYGIP